MAVSSFAPAAAGLQQYEELITSSKTWIKPAGVKTVEATIAGGGAVTATGAGGYTKQIIDVSGVASLPITIGAAGGTTTVGTTRPLGQHRKTRGIGMIPQRMALIFYQQRHLHFQIAKTGHQWTTSK